MLDFQDCEVISGRKGGNLDRHVYHVCCSDLDPLCLTAVPSHAHTTQPHLCKSQA